jgi:hypothetical protein
MRPPVMAPDIRGGSVSLFSLVIQFPLGIPENYYHELFRFKV